MKAQERHLSLVTKSESVCVTYDVGGYNSRRYSKPWIARITSWEVGEYPTLKFGSTVGSNVAEILAEVGSVVKYGQKDYRNPNGTVNEFGIVLEDGKIERITPAQAAQIYRAKQAA